VRCTVGQRIGVGIKAGGEGERHARKHGDAKRRPWRQIHLGDDAQTLGIRAIHCPAVIVQGKSAERDFTAGSVDDAPILPELLSQIPADVAIGSATAPFSAKRVSPAR
jgi:hypothetical protein